MTITSAFSLFLLITLSAGIYFTAKRLKFPYTVLLVLVGLLLVPITNLPYLRNVFGFISDMALTPEVLFYIFLPILIFEAGYNIRIRKMLDSAWSISLMSIVSLIISVLVTAGLLYYALPMIGIEIPFIIALLFGAIISPTDPVAVLSIFKESGVPHRLSLMFEGESLLNDGTAMALFLVLLSVATLGYHGTETIVSGVVNFTAMIVMGAIIGLVLAVIFSKAATYTKKNEFVTVTLLIISAHMVFIISELINQSGIIHVSPIIATTVSSLYLGNYARTILSPHVDEYLGKLIEHMSFVVNSLVFLMAGLLFASSGVNFIDLWLPILITVLIVAFARVVAIYTVIPPLNWFKVEEHIPSSWQKLLAWGSLRGALSIIIVLLIPSDFKIDGWTLERSPRDFLLALTIGCILATLFIKAPLIKSVMRRYGITSIDPLKEAYEADLGIYYLLTERSRLLDYKSKGFVSPLYYDNLLPRIEVKFAQAQTKRAELESVHGNEIFCQALHLSMIHIEKAVAKKLFMNEEVSVSTFRKIHSKLTLQEEKIEHAQHNNIDTHAFRDRKDIFDIMAQLIKSPFEKIDEATKLQRQFEFYRAQMIMARKAVQAVERMQNAYDLPTFLPQSYEEVISKYKKYKENNAIKMNALLSTNETTLSSFISKLSERSLSASGLTALHFMHDNGLTNEAMEEEILAIYTPNKEF